MSDEEYDQTRSAFELQVLTERYQRYHQSIVTLLHKALAYSAAVLLFLIGLFILTFRQGPSPRGRFLTSQEWPKLSHFKERLQGLLRSSQRKNEPRPHAH